MLSGEIAIIIINMFSCDDLDDLQMSIHWQFSYLLIFISSYIHMHCRTCTLTYLSTIILNDIFIPLLKFSCKYSLSAIIKRKSTYAHTHIYMYICAYINRSPYFTEKISNFGIKSIACKLICGYMKIGDSVQFNEIKPDLQNDM